MSTVLNTMSIPARLNFSFLVLLGLLVAVAVAAVSLQRLEGLTSKTQEIVDYQVRRVLLAQRFNQQAQAAVINLLHLLQTPERDDRVPLYAAMDEAIAASDRAVSYLGQTRLPPDVQADIKLVTDLRKRYGNLLQESVEMIEIEGAQPARRYFEDRTRKVLNTLLLETDALEVHVQQLMQAELEQLKQATANARRLVIFLALSALATGALPAPTVIVTLRFHASAPRR